MKKYILLLISLFFPLNCISSPKVYNLYPGEVKTFNDSYQDKSYYFRVILSSSKGIMINLTSILNYMYCPFKIDIRDFYGNQPMDSDITDVDEYWTKNIPIKSKHTIPNPFSEIYEYYFSTYTFENNYVGIHLLIIDTITSTFDIYVKEDKYEPEKKEEKEEEKGTHINEFVMFLLGVVGMAVLIGIIWFFTKTEAGLCILGCCCATFCSSEGGGD